VELAYERMFRCSDHMGFPCDLFRHFDQSKIKFFSLTYNENVSSKPLLFSYRRRMACSLFHSCQIVSMTLVAAFAFPLRTTSTTSRGLCCQFERNDLTTVIPMGRTCCYGKQDDDVTIAENKDLRLLDHYFLNSCCCSNRRQTLRTVLKGMFVGLEGLSSLSGPSIAAVTDETDTFGDNWWSSGIPTTSTGKPNQEIRVKSSSPPPLPSDEIVIQVSNRDLQTPEGLGLELGEAEFRTNRRVYVKSVRSGSIADRLGIRKDWIVVSINGNVRYLLGGYSY
jgi:hypothetical protein